MRRWTHVPLPSRPPPPIPPPPIYKIHKLQHFVTICETSLFEISNFHEQNHFITDYCSNEHSYMTVAALDQNVKTYPTTQCKFLLILKMGLPVFIGASSMQCTELSYTPFSGIVYWHIRLSGDANRIVRLLMALKMIKNKLPVRTLDSIHLCAPQPQIASWKYRSKNVNNSIVWNLIHSSKDFGTTNSRYLDSVLWKPGDHLTCSAHLRPTPELIYRPSSLPYKMHKGAKLTFLKVKGHPISHLNQEKKKKKCHLWTPWSCDQHFQ